MGAYGKDINAYDEMLRSRGFGDDEIEAGKRWLAIISGRTIRCAVDNIGTVSPLFDGYECSKVLLLYMLDALDYFEDSE